MKAAAHFRAHLGAFFYWTRFVENNVPFDNIPLQFIWSICSGNWVRIRVRLKSCTILAFLRRIRKMSTLSSANVMDVNLILKECTHKIKIKYSMHQYSILLHILGSWLIEEAFKNSSIRIKKWKTSKIWYGSSLSTDTYLVKLSRRSDQYSVVFFMTLLTDRQTERKTDKRHIKHNFFAEVIIACITQ